jgi:hypothetical protein
MSLNSLYKTEGDNFGGVIALQLILASDVLSIPEHDGITLLTSLPLRTGATIAALYYTKYSAAFDEDESDSDQGTIYKWKLSFSVPKNSPTIKRWLDNQRGKDLVAIVEDTNAAVQLVGTPATPLRLNYAFGTGDQVNKKNAYQFTLTGSSRDWALFYRMYELPEPHKVFGPGFSSGFLKT